jgi:uncharacterized protein (TIGR03382 family)
MKLRNLIVTLGLIASGNVFGTTYLDTIGEVAVPGNPFPHLDISSVQVTNTATVLSFKIVLNGDPVATDWGKYMIGFDLGAAGDTASNGWGRPISMEGGMEHWIGAWVDGGNGAELRSYSGAWALNSATYLPNPGNLAISKDASSVTISLDLVSLGLSVGNTFQFDVYSSGGGNADGAVDSLSLGTPSIADWGNTYQTATANSLSYTVIPEPASAVLGLAGMAVLLRRRRS